jgi:hypothetical protein
MILKNFMNEFKDDDESDDGEDIVDFLCRVGDASSSEQVGGELVH